MSEFIELTSQKNYINMNHVVRIEFNGTDPATLWYSFTGRDGNPVTYLTIDEGETSAVISWIAHHASTGGR